MAYKDRHNIARRRRNPQSDARLSFVQLESVLKVTTHEYHQPTCTCINMYKRDTNNQHVCATTCTREIPTTNMYVQQHVQERYQQPTCMCTTTCTRQTQISRTPPIFGPARPTSHIFPKFKAAVGSPPSTAARENRERDRGSSGYIRRVSSVKRSQVPVIEAF